MCWLSDLFSGKSNQDLIECRQDKLTLSASLNQKIQDVNYYSGLLAKEQSKVASLEARIGQLGKENQVLQKERDDATNKVILLMAQIKELNYEHGEVVNKLNQQICDLTPTAHNLARIIEENGLKIAAELSDGQRAVLWWDVEKAAWKAFAKQSILPYQDVEASWIKDSVDKYYNGNDAEHPKLEWCEFADNKYRITTMANVRKIFETSFVGLFPYISCLHDCDDFATEFKTHLNKYTLNSCLEAWGASGWGYHAYNLVVCSDGVLMIEPQAAGRGDFEGDKWCKELPAIIGDPGTYWIPRKVRAI